MGKWHSFGGQAHKREGYVIEARNIKTGKIVRIAISSREEYAKMRWYPSNDYAPLAIYKRK